MNENPGGTPNPLNPTPLTPVQPETPETPEMMAGPWSNNAAAGAAGGETITVNTTGTTNVASQTAGEPIHVAGLTRRPTGSVRPARPAMRAGRQATMQDIRPKPMSASASAGSGVRTAGMDEIGLSGDGIEDMVAQVTPQDFDEPVMSTRGSMVGDGKKKKHGWIIALIVLLVAAIGAAVAAIVILDPFGFKEKEADDPVALAIAKLSSDDAPKKLSLKGSLMLTPQNTGTPSNVTTIKFDSGVDLVSKANFLEATVTTKADNGDGVELGLEEIYTEDGDLYLRLNDITVTTNEPEADENGELAENCVAGVDEFGNEMNCLPAENEDASLFGVLSAQLLEQFSGEWIRIPAGEASELADGFSLGANPLTCLADSARNLDSLWKVYNANPFITSTPANAQNNAGNDPLYKLGINSEKWNSFNEAFANSSFISSYNSCMAERSGYGEYDYDAAIDMENGIFDDIEEAYVGIDSNNNITKLTLSTRDDEMLAALEVNIGYPKTVTIDEPDSYIGIEELMQAIFMNLVNGFDAIEQPETDPEGNYE